MKILSKTPIIIFIIVEIFLITLWDINEFPIIFSLIFLTQSILALFFFLIGIENKNSSKVLKEKINNKELLISLGASALLLILLIMIGNNKSINPENTISSMGFNPLDVFLISGFFITVISVWYSLLWRAER